MGCNNCCKTTTVTSKISSIFAAWKMIVKHYYLEERLSWKAFKKD